MTHPLGRALALAAFFALALPAYAQSDSHPVTSDPLDPLARSTPYVRPSAMTRFRGMDDVSPVSWQDANVIVHTVGGWRAYAREAQAAQKRSPVEKSDLVEVPASGNSSARQP